MQNRHNMQFNTLNTHTVNIKIINKIELIFQTIECNTFTLNTHTVKNFMDNDLASYEHHSIR